MPDQMGMNTQRFRLLLIVSTNSLQDVSHQASLLTTSKAELLFLVDKTASQSKQLYSIKPKAKLQVQRPRQTKLMVTMSFQLDTFDLFPKLPPELQQVIWEYALPYATKLDGKPVHRVIRIEAYWSANAVGTTDQARFRLRRMSGKSNWIIYYFNGLLILVQT